MLREIALPGPLSEKEKLAVKLLVDAQQTHIFDNWIPNADDNKKRKLFSQVNNLNSNYPGGILNYVSNAKSLLQESFKGINPFEDWIPSVPVGERLSFNTDEFHTAEADGMSVIHQTSFVLVAGGIGERLGYNGIKIALACEITTGQCFLSLFISHILSLQEKARELTNDMSVELHLAIMTSGDTNDLTVDLLDKNSNFGMKDDQIAIIQQEKVPSLMDNDAHFAMEDPFTIQTKPHGHGDVHSLLLSSGILKRWVDSGTKWIVFFQDTNIMVFRGIPSLLGISKARNFEVNSLTVPRMPNEAVGAIIKLENKKEIRSMTCNVEYNQLDSLLRESISPNGDQADESGFSPYPGNVNVLVFSAEPYLTVLTSTKGLIPEFINPKYTDSQRLTFIKPTRVECMMQDYPKFLGKEARVGFTQLDRWLCFSAVKNNVFDAFTKFQKTSFAESASTAEASFYFANRMFIEAAGCICEEHDSDKKIEYNGIPFDGGAHIVLDPTFGSIVSEIKSKFSKNCKISISKNSTLILKGSNIKIENLDLNGTLIICAQNGCDVTVRNLKVRNSGWKFTDILSKSKDFDEIYQIRGYIIEKNSQKEVFYENPGIYVINN